MCDGMPLTGNPPILSGPLPQLRASGLLLSGPSITQDVHSPLSVPPPLSHVPKEQRDAPDVLQLDACSSIQQPLAASGAPLLHAESLDGSECSIDLVGDAHPPGEAQGAPEGTAPQLFIDELMELPPACAGILYKVSPLVFAGGHHSIQ